MMEEKRRIWANKKLLAISIIIIVVISIILPAFLFSTSFKITIYGQDYLLVTYSFDIITDVEDHYVIKFPIPRVSYLPAWNIIDDLELLDGNLSMSQIVETRLVLESGGIREIQLDYLTITGNGHARAVFQVRDTDVGYFQGVNVNDTIELYFETSGDNVSVYYHLFLKKEMITPSGTTDFYYEGITGPKNTIMGCQGLLQNGWHEVELNFVKY